MTFSKDKDYYKTLEINASATASEVKKAYRTMALKTHPDKNPNSDGEAFKCVQEAYEVLSDETTRAEYDIFINEPESKNSEPVTKAVPTRRRRTAEEEKVFKEQLKAHFMRSQYKTREQKEAEEAEQRMRWLDISQEQKKELWNIYQEVLHDPTYLLQKKYSVETIKNLIHVFPMINLSHLDSESRNNPDIVDVTFEHSYQSLRYASKEVIMQLLDREKSELRKQLSYTEDYYWHAPEFLQFYPYEVDAAIFIKLISIQPILIKTLSQERILELLRSPICREHKKEISVGRLYKTDEKYGSTTVFAKTPTAINLEILLELYQNYDKDILQAFASFDSYSQNREELIKLIRALYIRHHKVIDFRSVISIYGLIDQNSLSFTYDEAKETVTCSGTLCDAADGSNCTFSFTLNIMEENTWGLFHHTFIYYLANNLQAPIFRKMLAIIPQEKRIPYLFSYHEHEVNSAFYAYKEEIQRKHHSYDEAENEVKKAQDLKVNIDALAELIYPMKAASAEELAIIKQEVCAAIHQYSSPWKLSLFGHHHEQRAQQVLKAINNAKSVEQISLIIDNQLALCENKVNDPLFHSQNRLFILPRIFDEQDIDWKAKERWFNSAPKNLKPQDNLTSSGYYRALKSAQEMISKYKETPDLGTAFSSML